MGEVISLYRDVFTRPPWNDDWGEDNRLEAYIDDLTGNRNSLSYGIYEDGVLIGAALGSVRHWYTGTQYYIDELFISTDLQGQGFGTLFIGQLTVLLRERGISSIFLQTNRNVPAFGFYLKNGFEEMERQVSLLKKII